MYRFKNVVSLILCLAFVCSLCPIVTYADTTLSIGDYFTLGKYNNEPILWRYVADDENGKLIVSDKIICFKSFDSPGENKTGSHTRNGSRGSSVDFGNNYWGDSNIRSWLNSDQEKVTWQCGNPPYYKYDTDGIYDDYASEKGFLSDGNFSNTERLVFKSVTQKSILDIVDAEVATGGSVDVWNVMKDELCNGGWTGITFGSLNVYDKGKLVKKGDLFNPDDFQYDEVCFENVTDKVFLMDTKQCWNVHQNEEILGADYCHTTATQTALDKVGYNTLYTSNEYLSYYLRTPYGMPHKSARDVLFAGDLVLDDSGVGTYSRNFEGIRPAFYLDEENALITSGSGTAEDPYVMDGKYIKVVCNGAEVNFDVLPIMENDRVLVPMRAIFETLGATVEWEGETQTVTATKDGTVITLQIGSNILTKNGEKITLDVPAQLVNDRTLVPICAVSESLNAVVDWIDSEKTVVITN